MGSNKRSRRRKQQQQHSLHQKERSTDGALPPNVSTGASNLPSESCAPVWSGSTASSRTAPAVSETRVAVADSCGGRRQLRSHRKSSGKATPKGGGIAMESRVNDVDRENVHDGRRRGHSPSPHDESHRKDTPSSVSRCCAVCNNDFTRLRKGHKCRLCRKAVCAPCSTARVPISGFAEPQRACCKCSRRQLHGASDGRDALVTVPTARAPRAALTAVAPHPRVSVPVKSAAVGNNGPVVVKVKPGLGKTASVLVKVPGTDVQKVQPPIVSIAENGQTVAAVALERSNEEDEPAASVQQAEASVGCAESTLECLTVLCGVRSGGSGNTLVSTEGTVAVSAGDSDGKGSYCTLARDDRVTSALSPPPSSKSSKNSSTGASPMSTDDRDVGDDDDDDDDDDDVAFVGTTPREATRETVTSSLRSESPGGRRSTRQSGKCGDGDAASIAECLQVCLRGADASNEIGNTKAALGMENSSTKQMSRDKVDKEAPKEPYEVPSWGTDVDARCLPSLVRARDSSDHELFGNGALDVWPQLLGVTDGRKVSLQPERVVAAVEAAAPIAAAVEYEELGEDYRSMGEESVQGTAAGAAAAALEASAADGATQQVAREGKEVPGMAAVYGYQELGDGDRSTSGDSQQYCDEDNLPQALPGTAVNLASDVACEELRLDEARSTKEDCVYSSDEEKSPPPAPPSCREQPNRDCEERISTDSVVRGGRFEKTRALAQDLKSSGGYLVSRDDQALMQPPHEILCSPREDEGDNLVSRRQDGGGVGGDLEVQSESSQKEKVEGWVRRVGGVDESSRFEEYDGEPTVSCEGDSSDTEELFSAVAKQKEIDSRGGKQGPEEQQRQQQQQQQGQNGEQEPLMPLTPAKAVGLCSNGASSTVATAPSTVDTSTTDVTPPQTVAERQAMAAWQVDRRTSVNSATSVETENDSLGGSGRTISGTAGEKRSWLTKLNDIRKKGCSCFLGGGR
ncbi:unnamed protein product [Sphacelaria rigidula]